MIILTLIVILILLFLFLNINNSSTAATTPNTRPEQTDVNEEIQVFNLVNEQRKASNLPSLQYSERLALIARNHSADMFYKNYVDHVSPQGEKPTDRLNKASIVWKLSGENILVGSNITSATAVAVWMNSSGHRQNILNRNFGKTGVGLFKTSSGISYYTQLFID